MRNLLIYSLVICGIFTCAAEPVFMREVTVNGNSQKPTTVKLEFYIPASCKGYRLVSRHSKEYAFTEYFRRGSLVKIFFEARSGKKLDLVFYKEAVRHFDQAQTSGILHRVKKFNNSNVRSLRMFKRLWEKSDYSGACFEKKIFSGWNPFGPVAGSLHWYSAFIKIPQSGKWTFFSASTDASFLLIDDQLVVNSPGRKWIRDGLEGEIHGTVNLRQGIHRLDYLHANNNPLNCYAVAAFLPPGAPPKKLKVIPEDYYTPVLTADAGPLQTYSRKITGDFSWQMTDTVEIDHLQMYVVKFKTPFRKFFTWSLGSKEPEFNYFYFKPGKYPVKFKCNMGEISQNVVIDYQYMFKPLNDKKVRTYILEALAQERRSSLQPEGYAFLASALVKLEMNEQAEEFYKQLLAKQNVAPPEITFRLFNDLILHDLLRHESYREAEKQLDYLTGRIKSPALLSVANLSSAELQFYCFGNLARSRKYFSRIKRADLPAGQLRFNYDLLEADFVLMSKGLDPARKLYQKIEPVSKVPENRSEIILSGMMIAIRNCYILKNYETAMKHVERLEAACPKVRLQAAYLLLKAKILKELKRPRRAANIFLRLLKTEASKATSADADWELAQFYFENKQYLLTRKRLNDILANAPRSREAAEAAGLMEKLNQESRQ